MTRADDRGAPDMLFMLTIDEARQRLNNLRQCFARHHRGLPVPATTSEAASYAADHLVRMRFGPRSMASIVREQKARGYDLVFTVAGLAPADRAQAYADFCASLPPAGQYTARAS